VLLIYSCIIYIYAEGVSQQIKAHSIKTVVPALGDTDHELFYMSPTMGRDPPSCS
jgi:hypothetical protein